MKKTICLVLFSLSALLGNAQSNATNFENKNSIVSSFSEASILAYQDLAVDKINDFYSYLNFYKEVNSVALQQEIGENIRTVFLNEDVAVLNFIEDKNEVVPLRVLLSECEKRKATYEASNFKKEMASNANFFLIAYDLEIKNRVIKKYKLIQKVYFFPSVKNFGSEKKNIWQLKLGEFNAVQ